MNTKNILIIVAVALLIGGAYWYGTTRSDKTQLSQETISQDNGRVAVPGETPSVDGKLKVANFSGKLEKVDTGCFVDGECYVIVDGKHITTTMGWSRETVGSVQGVESFGDLEKHIGEDVEVYAQDKGDGTYTLYGSEGFYVKLKDDSSTSMADELVEAKFKLAIRNFWNVEQVFRNPNNKNQFYYAMQDSANSRIMMYDLSKDAAYAKDTTFNIPEGSREAVAKKLAANREFWGVGFSGNMFVFLETTKDNSPGPCASPWLLSGPAVTYYSVDTTISKPTVKPFTIPAQLKASEEAKQSACVKNLGN